MAKKISELPAAVSVADADVAAIVQGGVTKKAAASLFAVNAFAGKTTTDLAEGTNLYYTAARFDTAFAGKSTTDLAEGTNLYYTAARFDTALATKDTDDLAEGATNKYYSSSLFDTDFAGKTTTDLAEGTNLYYTTARFDTAFAGKSTTDLAEGTNLYYTTARFDTALATKDTDDLAEGATNLYYTDARARLALSATSPISYDNTTGVISLLTVPIASGGTGQVTANSAFDALSPMTTDYDLITQVSGLPVRFAKGADNTMLQTVGGVLTWVATPSPYATATINSNTSGSSGTTYLCDTSGGAFNLTLPTPANGAFVIIKDKTGSFGTNNLTVVRNGSENIEGLAASKVLATNWGSWSIFSDGTDWFMGPF